jgi:hypothetical protein
MKRNTLIDYRECSECGEPTPSFIDPKNGNLRFKKVCSKCNLKRSKNYSFDTCSNCGDEKEPNYRRKCNDCEADYVRLARLPITGEELVMIKKWVQKQIKFNFNTDLKGLNEMITIYQKICKSFYDFSSMAGNKQLDKMWKSIWRFYNAELKDIPDELLINMVSDRSTKKIVNKKKSLNAYMNDDIKILEKFIQHIDSFEIEGKIFNLENEVNLCTMGNKTACARVRKILQALKNDIKELKNLSTKMTKTRF